MSEVETFIFLMALIIVKVLQFCVKNGSGIDVQRIDKDGGAVGSYFNYEF